MRTASADLKAFLRSRAPCFKADLFTYTLLSGPVYRWTTFDQSINYGGHTWVSLQGLIQRKSLTVRNTVEVPSLEMTLLTPPGFLINGIDPRKAVEIGLFDGAVVEMDRAFMPTPGDTSLGIVLMFLGRQSGASFDSTGIQLSAKGDNVLMNQYIPKNNFQTICLHTFCDAGCTLNPATFTTTNTVGFGSTDSNIVWGSLPGSPSDYTLGKITITSGPAAGQIRTIKVASNTGITPAYPFDDTPQLGDTFSVLKGCDRSQTTCQNKFANLQHFRAFPFVPPAETGV